MELELADSYRMWHREGLLPPESCARLIDEVETLDAWVEFSVDASNDANNMGVSQWVYDLPAGNCQELYGMVWNEMLIVNEYIWDFHIDNWHQPLRVAKYTPGLSHDWHVDYTDNDRSKLAVSLALNDGYTGGDLCILEGGQINKPAVGQATWFPAYQGHRVTPVESGVRYVLLGWFTGPRFR